jgi:hypothetical protein
MESPAAVPSSIIIAVNEVIYSPMVRRTKNHQNNYAYDGNPKQYLCRKTQRLFSKEELIPVNITYCILPRQLGSTEFIIRFQYTFSRLQVRWFRYT